MCGLGSRWFFTLLFLDGEKKYSRNLTLRSKFFDVPRTNLAGSGSSWNHHQTQNWKRCEQTKENRKEVSYNQRLAFKDFFSRHSDKCRSSNKKVCNSQVYQKMVSLFKRSPLTPKDKNRERIPKTNESRFDYDNWNKYPKQSVGHFDVEADLRKSTKMKRCPWT